jgi:Protein of unknown function (DUF2384)
MCVADVYGARSSNYDERVTFSYGGSMKSNTNDPAAEGLTSYTDGSASTIAVLVALVQLIVEQSGNPRDFDAQSWLNRWLHSPVPALGSRPPIELLGTPDGVALIFLTIARMQSGAFM